MSKGMLDKVFDTIQTSNADVETVWISTLALGIQALRHADELSRERMLRSVERDLRTDLAEFNRLLEARNHAS